MGCMFKAISQIAEENFEVDKIVLPERILEKICAQNGVQAKTGICSVQWSRNLSRCTNYPSGANF